ncbi:cyclin-A3-4-like isoform X2 [Prunus avium]|uniref:B-like cyclin n=1 Tax=Prunus avium TaxID=42229 RepID=A0A6P5TJJ4_PRUAV|nr:cyclin-A3-4-like isoform X2 [Prunus avium]
MDEQENSLSTTPSSNKRPSMSPSRQIPAPKKRVVLGEISNSTNDVVSTQNSAPKKPKSSLKKKKKKTTKREGEALKTEIVVRSVDPRKSDHSSSIYRHLLSLEMDMNKRSSPSYMGRVQNDISPNMREILVDWLVEVAEEYQLVTDTLFLTVSYIDRYLSSYAISRNKKYEEICPPRVEDFCYITDNTYIMEEVLEMERDVLKFLNFDTGPPTTKNFLRILMRAALENYKSSKTQLEFLSCYLVELSLLDYSCVQFLPSVVAASAIFLSRFTIQPEVHPWSLALQSYSGYRPSDLKMCVRAIHDLQLNIKGSSLRAVRDKYRKPKYACVGTLTSLPEIPAIYFEAIDI